MACDSDVSINTLRCAVDCSSQPCNIEAYGDIGGIGVILSFTVTAWFVVVFLLVYYIMVYDYSLDTFRPKDDFETLAAYPNPVDRVFLSIVRKWRAIDFSQESVETRRTVNREFNKCIAALADLQIMTGIGILISGIKPTICGLQAYHLQVIIHLAWFSSITHLAALSFLRHYLINRRWQLYTRGALIAVMAGLLAGAVGLAGHFNWDDLDSNTMPSYIARCLLEEKLDRSSLAFEASIFDILLITYGYSIRLLKTWRRVSDWSITISKVLCDSSSRRLQAWRPHQTSGIVRGYLATGIIQPLYDIAFRRVLYLQLNVFTSYLAEVFWLIFSITWRTTRLTRLILGHRPPHEYEWAFGQVLPLVMMAAPLILLFAPVASLYRISKRRKARIEQSYPLESIATPSYEICRRGSSSGNIRSGERDDSNLVVGTPSFTCTPSTPDEQDITETTDADLATQQEGAETLPRPHIAREGGSEPSIVSYGARGSGPRAQEATARQNSDNYGRDDEQPDDDDNARFLESSSAFQGGLLLVAWPYVEFAIYLIIGNRKGVIIPIMAHVLSLGIVNPLLQAFWLVYTTWGSRISVGPSVIRFDVFATLLAASFVQRGWGLGSTSIGALYPSGVGATILLGVYIMLALWAITTARGGGKPSNRPPIGNPRWIVCGVLVACAIPCVYLEPKSIAFPIGFHVILLMVTRMPWNFGHAEAFCVTLFIIVAIGFQAWRLQLAAERHDYTGSFINYPLFLPIMDYPLWMFGWALVIALWPLGRPMARGIASLAERFFGSRIIGV